MRSVLVLLGLWFLAGALVAPLLGRFLAGADARPRP